MLKSLSLTDRVFIVTGASSGIGRALCIHLATRNARVIAAARNLELLQSLADEIGDADHRFIYVDCDITKPDDVKRLFNLASERFGSVDVLIANAGQYIRGRLKDSPVDLYRRSMEVNYFGSLNCIKQAWEVMSAAGSGHVVIINSLDAKKGITGDGPYVAAKSALAGLADVLRQEGKEHGIHVMSVFPGRVDTPMISDLRVPRISSKISINTVVRAIIRGIEKNKTEVVVPRSLAPIGVLNNLFPRFMDWTYKRLNIEGESRI